MSLANIDHMKAMLQIFKYYIDTPKQAWMEATTQTKMECEGLQI